MIVRTTLGRDGQKAGSAGGHPWGGRSPGLHEKPYPPRGLKLTMLRCLLQSGKRRGMAVSAPPKEQPGAESGGVWVGGMPVRRGEGRQAFCLDLGITLLHRKSREEITLSAQKNRTRDGQAKETKTRIQTTTTLQSNRVDSEGASPSRHATGIADEMETNRAGLGEETPGEGLGERKAQGSHYTQPGCAAQQERRPAGNNGGAQVRRSGTLTFRKKPARSAQENKITKQIKLKGEARLIAKNIQDLLLVWELNE